MPALRELDLTRHSLSSSLHASQVDDPSKYGVVVMDEQGKVERFVEKPQVRAASGGCLVFW